MSNDLLADVIWKSVDLTEPDDFEFKDIGELVWVKAILAARTDEAPNLERLLFILAPPGSDLWQQIRGDSFCVILTHFTILSQVYGRRNKRHGRVPRAPSPIQWSDSDLHAGELQGYRGSTRLDNIRPARQIETCH